ncbi:MAG TPA: hypothetical protein VEB40_06590, partial [Flavipsychrobacter sp.]|nr:hypothetical protein [Flavipsychrobacter sp.]
MRRIGLFIALALVVHSCKKKETGSSTPVEEIKGDAIAVVVNKIPDSVYISFSGLDIATGTRPHLIGLTLPPSDTLIIERADLKDSYRYQYEWHTKDHTYSSWLATDMSGYHKGSSFDYFGESQDYVLMIEGAQRNEQLICLDGDGFSSTWEAVDAFDASGASIWNSLTEREQAHSFTISRFHTVKHSFIDTSDRQRTTNLAFALDMSSQHMWLKVEQKADSYVLCNDLSPHLSVSTQARDTLYFSRFTSDSTGITYPQP